MLAYALGGLTALVGLILLLRWFVTAEPRDILRVLRISAIVLGSIFIIYMAVAGRWQLLPALLFIGLPWLNRLRMLRTLAKNAAGPTPGQNSQVETRYLQMTLDHDSGQMTGEVRAGAFAGAQVEDLDLADLLLLLAECRQADEQSVPVIEAFLDRRFGAEWRDDAGGAGDGGGGGRGLTREDAYDILGLKPGADRSAIEQAYRRMMQKLHPDHGGSDYLAAQINRAKDLLLGE